MQPADDQNLAPRSDHAEKHRHDAGCAGVECAERAVEDERNTMGEGMSPCDLGGNVRDYLKPKRKGFAWRPEGNSQSLPEVGVRVADGHLVEHPFGKRSSGSSDVVGLSVQYHSRELRVCLRPPSRGKNIPRALGLKHPS